MSIEEFGCGPRCDQHIDVDVVGSAVAIGVTCQYSGASIAEANDLSETEAAEWLAKWLRREFA